MGWFQRGQRDGQGDDEAANAGGASQEAEGRELFLPGGIADESVNSEGRGFFVLGGSKRSGGIQYVSVDEKGQAFIEVEGRRIMANVPDLLPKDQQEISRLDFQHHLLRNALGGNYAAPIAQPARILDVGCGTGRWAIEMAVAFPFASVVGLDIFAPSTHSGPLERLPKNYQFVTGNILEELPFPDKHFDFVHMRLLFTAIPADHWPEAVRKLMRVTRPGGWVELVESGLPRNGGPALDQLTRWIMQVSAHRGIDLHLGAEIGRFLQMARAQHIVTREMAFPVGNYGGRIGQMMAVDAFAMFESLRALVVIQGVAPPQQYDQALADARNYTLLNTSRCFLPFYLAYGQRASY